jgi:GH43 family beta-xylosidase
MIIIRFYLLSRKFDMTMNTYTNPIFDGYFADPFILKHDGMYYAYGTSPASDDAHQFPILSSPDLIEWKHEGYALDSLEGKSAYWAPEVVHHEGKFYMYYSAGVEDKGHQLRVAVSNHPASRFIDTGHILTPDLPFAIDPHPFQDYDGQWYLFYAKDFLTKEDGYQVGTGIVVDRLVDMFTLEGQPQLVIRPFADWQLFEAQRPIYDQLYDWYTIEGPSLRVHNGRYYCFYSGGAWERENYGVSYVVADHPLGKYTSPTDLDGALFQSVRDIVYGPGHNSFVKTDSDNEYIIYHAWDTARTARKMCIDRLTWEDDKPVLHGPTWTPQSLPN